jgi:hypothetical protein
MRVRFRRHPTTEEIVAMRQIIEAKQRLAHRVQRGMQEGKIGYILLWLLGVPIPVLFAIFLLRGCD